VIDYGRDVVLIRTGAEKACAARGWVAFGESFEASQQFDL
jgi:hypothetical protein